MYRNRSTIIVFILDTRHSERVARGLNKRLVFEHARWPLFPGFSISLTLRHIFRHFRRTRTILSKDFAGCRVNAFAIVIKMIDEFVAVEFRLPMNVLDPSIDADDHSKISVTIDKWVNLFQKWIEI